MGAYCPTPLVTDQMLARVEEKILVPTVHQMKRSRRPFRGVLYAGLMVTSQGLKVLEYNVRFGDPECQPLLDAAQERPGRSAGSDGRRPARRSRAAGMGPAAGRVRRDGQRRLPGQVRAGSADPRPRRSGASCRT